MKKTGLIVASLFLVIYASGQTFFFAENPKEDIRTNKIVREEIYDYTFNKKGIKDSALSAICWYDTAGNLVEKRQRKSVTKYSNTYDPSGRLIKQISSREDLKLVTILEYEYDSLGNELTKYNYNKDTTRLTVEQKIYNDDNQVVQLVTTLNGNPPYISRRFYYGTANDLIKIEALDSKGNIIYSFIYDYDSVENKKTTYLENGEGRRKSEVVFYNSDMRSVKEYSTSSKPASIGPDNIEYTEFEKRIEYSYNPDRTIFESSAYGDGKKVQMSRRFYFKK